VKTSAISHVPWVASSTSGKHPRLSHGGVLIALNVDSSDSDRVFADALYRDQALARLAERNGSEVDDRQLEHWAHVHLVTENILRVQLDFLRRTQLGSKG